MSDNVRHLRISKKKTPLEESRADVVQMLEETLAEARRGEIDEIVILGKCAQLPGGDDEWLERASATQNMRAWIGALEMMKADWIEMYRVFREIR